MSFRNWLKRLERVASEDLESFVLLDGSTYYYDRLETYKVLFLHACDVQLGDADKWPEPPEVYRKIFVNVAELYDTDVLVNERRLVPTYHPPVEDLSE